MRRRLRVGTHHASRRTFLRPFFHFHSGAFGCLELRSGCIPMEGIVAIERVRFWAFLSTVTVPICILSSSRGHCQSVKGQSVSYFTVPPRAHPSTGSQSGSATPGLTQVPSTRSRGYSIVASEVNLSQRTWCSLSPVAFCPELLQSVGRDCVRHQVGCWGRGWGGVGGLCHSSPIIIRLLTLACRCLHCLCISGAALMMPSCEQRQVGSK